VKRNRQKLVVVGGGGHARVLASILKRTNNFDLVGYTDPEDRGDLLGTPYLGTDAELETLFKGGVLAAALGVGGLLDASPRIRLYNQLKKVGFHLPVILAPSAVVQENVFLGEGSVILEGGIVNTGSKVGICGIVNTNSSVGHDCQLGDFVHVAPRAVLGGNVKVGNRVHIGLGASVIQGICIGDDVVIGAGSLVVKNCLKAGKYLGVPAKCA